MHGDNEQNIDAPCKGEGKPAGNGEKQVGRESENVKSTSLSPSKKSMRRSSEESDQIEPVQGCSASLVPGKPIDRNRIPAKLEDVAAGSGQVPGLNLAEKEIVGEDVNVVEEEREKDVGQVNEHCAGCSLTDEQTLGKEVNVKAEERKDCLDLRKKKR